jgi:hypothetical protein
MDLEGSERRGMVGRSSLRNKGRFAVLRRDNVLGILNMLSSFQPSVMEIHEDVGSNFIFDATDKTFTEEGIIYALHSES